MAKTLLLAIALMFILEGLTYASSPEMMKEIMKKMQLLDNNSLRKMGLTVAAIGFILFIIFYRINA
jgi:uncharacterized protein YjeT (DUF2065 family)